MGFVCKANYFSSCSWIDYPNLNWAGKENEWKKREFIGHTHYILKYKFEYIKEYLLECVILVVCKLFNPEGKKGKTTLFVHDVYLGFSCTYMKEPKNMKDLK